MKRTTTLNTSLVGLAVAFVAGCGGEPGPGTLTVTLYGEEFIEEGIPDTVLVDGWAISFDKFLVSLGEVTVAAGDRSPAVDAADYRVYDLTRGSEGQGTLVTQAEVAGDTYDNTGYRIAPSAAATAGNADPADVAYLVDNGLSIYLVGSATKGATTKTFAWSFDNATRYGRCESVADIDGDDAITQITLHGDHLFYDDLLSSEPNVAFDVLARADDDGDGDGDITPAELLAFQIATLERYQVGSLEIENLWDYVDFLTSTLGHIDGEGHCNTIARE